MGLVPADIVRQHSCSSEIFANISSACIPDQNPQNILGSQHLFSVYIHTPPGQPGVTQTSCLRLAKVTEPIWCPPVPAALLSDMTSHDSGL